MFTSVSVSMSVTSSSVKLSQKKLNNVLESQKTIVLRSQDAYAVKYHMCSETITEKIDVADVVEDAEKCRRQWRSNLQKRHCDRARYPYNTQ